MSGYLYVLRSGDFFKIGWSRNPRSRLKIAKTFNPHPVELVAYREAPAADEAASHAQFSAYRVFGSEWFSACPEIEEWALAMGRPGGGALKDWMMKNRGGQAFLAKVLNVTPANISQWERVPAEHVIRVEAHTGLSRHDLRPDVFGKAPTKESA